VDENAVFCRSCGAGQIRVTTPGTNQPIGEASPEATAPPAAVEYPSEPEETAEPEETGIQWRAFMQFALPFAALTGFITSLFPPIVLLALPLNFRRVLLQYRSLHPAPLGSGRGARLGSAMAVLSFVFFIPFFALTIYLGRDSLISRIRDMAAQNPDPQAQQVLLWCATKAGFIATSGLALGFFLVLFLFVGLLSGSLMTGEPKNRR